MIVGNPIGVRCDENEAHCPSRPLDHDWKVSAMGEFYTYVSARNEEEAIQKAKGRNMLRSGTPLVSFNAEPTVKAVY